MSPLFFICIIQLGTLSFRDKITLLLLIASIVFYNHQCVQTKAKLTPLKMRCQFCCLKLNITIQRGFFGFVYSRTQQRINYPLLRPLFQMDYFFMACFSASASAAWKAVLVMVAPDTPSTFVPLDFTASSTSVGKAFPPTSGVSLSL